MNNIDIAQVIVYLRILFISRAARWRSSRVPPTSTKTRSVHSTRISERKVPLRDRCRWPCVTSRASFAWYVNREDREHGRARKSAREAGRSEWDEGKEGEEEEHVGRAANDANHTFSPSYTGRSAREDAPEGACERGWRQRGDPRASRDIHLSAKTERGESDEELLPQVHHIQERSQWTFVLRILALIIPLASASPLIPPPFLFVHLTPRPSRLHPPSISSTLLSMSLEFPLINSYMLTSLVKETTHFQSTKLGINNLPQVEIPCDDFERKASELSILLACFLPLLFPSLILRPLPPSASFFPVHPFPPFSLLPRSLSPFSNYWDCDRDRKALWPISDITDLIPFYKSAQFESNNFAYDKKKRVIVKRFAWDWIEGTHSWIHDVFLYFV